MQKIGQVDVKELRKYFSLTDTNSTVVQCGLRFIWHCTLYMLVRRLWVCKFGGECPWSREMFGGQIVPGE